MYCYELNAVQQTECFLKHLTYRIKKKTLFIFFTTVQEKDTRLQ